MTRVRSGLEFAFIAGAVIAVVAVGSHYIGWPLVTAALGPTIYFFAAHPHSETTAIRNAVTGHAVGAAAGLASLAVFGLWSVRGIADKGYLSWSRVGAVIMAIALTLFVLELIDTHHAPAGATSLLVATGLARPGPPLYGLLVGLAIVILIGPAISRVVAGGLPDREGDSAIESERERST